MRPTRPSAPFASRQLLLVTAAFALLAAPVARAGDGDEAEEGEAAAAPEVAVDLEAAKKTLTEYLEAAKADPKKLKGKKWDAVKKATHPKALAKIADIKKRTQLENHGLAWWAKAAEYVLTNFQVGEARQAVRGTAVIRTVEDHFSVEDQGDEPGIEVEYLLVQSQGRFFVADRRLGSGQFKDESIEAGYRGYFDGEFEVPVEKGAKKKGK